MLKIPLVLLTAPRKTKLTQERKRLKIPSVRQNPTAKQSQLEALTELSEQNPSGTWGVGQIRGRLAQEGIFTNR
jgi:hypothetical protein